MRLLSQQEEIDRLPDGMVKKVVLHILNTPKPDFTELDKEIDEENARRLAQMDEKTRERVLAMPSY
jgi:hypothetical protein